MAERSDPAADAEYIPHLYHQIRDEFESLESKIRNLPAPSNPNTHQASLESLIRQRDDFLQQSLQVGQLLVEWAAFYLSLDRLRTIVDRVIEGTGAYSLNKARNAIRSSTMFWADACKQNSWHLCQRSRRLGRNIDYLRMKIRQERGEDAFWGI